MEICVLKPYPGSRFFKNRIQPKFLDPILLKSTYCKIETPKYWSMSPSLLQIPLGKCFLLPGMNFSNVCHIHSTHPIDLDPFLFTISLLPYACSRTFMAISPLGLEIYSATKIHLHYFRIWQSISYVNNFFQRYWFIKISH